MTSSWPRVFAQSAFISVIGDTFLPPPTIRGVTVNDALQTINITFDPLPFAPTYYNVSYYNVAVEQSNVDNENWLDVTNEIVFDKEANFDPRRGWLLVRQVPLHSNPDPTLYRVKMNSVPPPQPFTVKPVVSQPFLFYMKKNCSGNGVFNEKGLGKGGVFETGNNAQRQRNGTEQNGRSNRNRKQKLSATRTYHRQCASDCMQRVHGCGSVPFCLCVRPVLCYVCSGIPPCICRQPFSGAGCR